MWVIYLYEFSVPGQIYQYHILTFRTTRVLFPQSAIGLKFNGENTLQLRVYQRVLFVKLTKNKRQVTW